MRCGYVYSTQRPARGAAAGRGAASGPSRARCTDTLQHNSLVSRPAAVALVVAVATVAVRAAVDAPRRLHHDPVAHRPDIVRSLTHITPNHI